MTKFKETCTVCNGTGIVKDIDEYDPSVPWNEQTLVDVVCYHCDGDKEVELTFHPIPGYGDLISMQEFEDACNCGCFIDYDGSGYYATANQESNLPIKPSHVKSGIHLTKFSYVVWYNR